MSCDRGSGAPGKCGAESESLPMGRSRRAQRTEIGVAALGRARVRPARFIPRPELA